MSGRGTALNARSRFARDEGTFFASGTSGPPPRSLHHAAEQGDARTLTDLLKRGVNIDEPHAGLPALLYAIRAGRLDAVALLLEHSADVDARACVLASAWSITATATWTAVHCAAQRDDAEALALLLNRGADIGARATGGITALHLAAYHGGLVAAQLLVARGANVNAADDDGLTALDDACYRRAFVRLAFKCRCVQQGIPAGARRARIEEITALLEAVAPMAASERVEFARRAWQRSAAQRLLAVAEADDAATLSRMLDHGADISARDLDGSSALHVACDAGASVTTLALLLDRGVEVDARNNYLDTALHGAAHGGRPLATLLLCARGADVGARNRFGKTPRASAEHGRQGRWRATLAVLEVANLLSAVARAWPCCRDHAK